MCVHPWKEPGGFILTPFVDHLSRFACMLGSKFNLVQCFWTLTAGLLRSTNSSALLVLCFQLRSVHPNPNVEHKLLLIRTCARTKLLPFFYSYNTTWNSIYDTEKSRNFWIMAELDLSHPYCFSENNQSPCFCGGLTSGFRSDLIRQAEADGWSRRKTGGSGAKVTWPQFFIRGQKQTRLPRDWRPALVPLYFLGASG